MLGLQEWMAIQIAPVQAQARFAVNTKKQLANGLAIQVRGKGKKKRKTGRDKIS